MNNPVREDYKNTFEEKIKEIGFNIVDSEDKADIIIKCRIEGALKEIIGEWQASPAKVSLLLPKSSYVIAEYDVTSAPGEGNIFISKIIMQLTDAVKKEYDSGRSKQMNGEGRVVNIFQKDIVWKEKSLKPQMALKEFTNVYIEAFNAKDYSPESAIQLPENNDYNRLVKKFKEKGVNVVNDISDADVIYKLKFLMKQGPGQMVLDKIWVEFVLPSNNYVIFSKDVVTKTGLLDVPIDIAVEKTVELAKDETLYKIVTTPQLSELTKMANLPGKNQKDKKGKLIKRDGWKFISNESDINVGILVLPIWGISAGAIGNGDPLAFADWLTGPKKSDKFYDINDDEKAKALKMYLVTRFDSEKLYESYNYKYAPYFSDDMRDVITMSTYQAVSGYKLNLFEIRFEDYLKELLNDDLDNVIKSIAQKNPNLQRLFVVYYLPFSDNGINMNISVSYYDLEKKDFESYLNQKEKIVLSQSIGEAVPYNPLVDKIKFYFRKIFKGQQGLTDFADQNKKNMEIVCKKNAILYYQDNQPIMKILPGNMVNVISENNGKSEVIAEFFISMKDFEAIDTSNIHITGNKVFISPEFQNIYGYANPLLNKTFGEVIKKEPINILNKSNTSYGESYYKVQIKGTIDSAALTKDIDSLNKKYGEVKGALTIDGMPYANQQIFLIAMGDTVKTTTDDKGSFLFEKVPPMRYYYLVTEAKEETDSKKKEAKAVNIPLIFINPEETYEAGQINVNSKSGIINPGDLITALKNEGKYINIGSSKEQVFLYMGEPAVRYTDDVWYYPVNTSNKFLNFLFIQFKQNVVSNITTSVTLEE